MSLTLKIGKPFVSMPRRASELPSMPQRAANLGGAVVRTIRSVASGNRVKASPETIEKRKAICAACPHQIDGKCRRCGCPVTSGGGPIGLKTEYLAECCPDNPPRWPVGEMKGTP